VVERFGGEALSVAEQIAREVARRAADTASEVGDQLVDKVAPVSETLSELPVKVRRLPRWVFVAATATLGLAVVLLVARRRRNHDTPQELAGEGSNNGSATTAGTSRSPAATGGR
jgi:hypothetical protein